MKAWRTSLLFAVIFCSCSNENGGTKELKRVGEQFERGYTSSDPRVAERALLDYKAAFAKWQESGVTRYDYDHVFAVTDARLMVLYKQTGEAQKVDRYFREATNFMAQAANKHGSGATNWTPESLQFFIERADSNVFVLRWKREVER